MGLFKKKKKAEPGQQPAVLPRGAPAPQFFPPQQPGQFPAAGGMQQAPVNPQPAAAPPPTGFFGSGPQQIPPQAQAPVQQAPVQPPQPPMQQPPQLAQPVQHPKPAIPSFPKLSPGPRPAPAQPTPGQRQADAVAVKAAVQRSVTQPAQAAPLFGAPAAPEASDFFSELQKPAAGAGAAPAQSPGESPLGLVPLEAGREEAAVKEQPAAPTHSRGRDAMRGDQPIFVSVRQYVSLLDSLKDVRKSMKEFEKQTHSLDSLRKKTLSSCRDWQGHLDDIHKKLAYIDHILFER